jgi:putative pyruvate formate lyase activating enzyme
MVCACRSFTTRTLRFVEVLRLLDGIVDVYLPDLKYAEDEAGYLYSKVPRYREISRAALKEMFRQTGEALFRRMVCCSAAW